MTLAVRRSFIMPKLVSTTKLKAFFSCSLVIMGTPSNVARKQLTARHESLVTNNLNLQTRGAIAIHCTWMHESASLGGKSVFANLPTSSKWKSARKIVR